MYVCVCVSGIQYCWKCCAWWNCESCIHVFIWNGEFAIVLSEAVSQTRQSATSKYEAEHMQWLKHQTELEAEVQKLRSKLNHDRYMLTRTFLFMFSISYETW